MDFPRPTLSRASQEDRAPVSDPAEGTPSSGSAAPNMSGWSAATATPRASAHSWVVLAKLIRPHGRHGEMVAEILTDFPERFHQRSRLFLIPPEQVGSRMREVHLENFWFLRSRIVLKLQGIDSINEAECLRGFEVAIPAAERAPLDSGSVYVSDLIGCRVFDLNQAGADVGEITDVDRGSSSTELLVVRQRGARGNDAEVLIPFVKEFLAKIDVENGRLEMRLPEGLLEINAPMTEEEKQAARRESSSNES